MSTNEDLAVKARAGDPDALLRLWHQVRRFATWKARGYIRRGANPDDMEQAAFEALLLAVQGFDTDKGVFIGFYGFALRSAFRTAIYGGRTEKHQRDPIHTAISLDAPAGDDEDNDPLSDLIPDEMSEVAFCDVELDELSSAIRNALDALPERERQVILLHYWNGLTQAQAAQALSLSETEARRLEKSALRKLRRPCISKQLRSFL